MSKSISTRKRIKEIEYGKPKSISSTHKSTRRVLFGFLPRRIKYLISRNLPKYLYNSISLLMVQWVFQYLLSLFRQRQVGQKNYLNSKYFDLPINMINKLFFINFYQYKVLLVMLFWFCLAMNLESIFLFCSIRK